MRVSLGKKVGIGTIDSYEFFSLEEFHDSIDLEKFLLNLNFNVDRIRLAMINEKKSNEDHSLKVKYENKFTLRK